MTAPFAPGDLPEFREDDVFRWRYRDPKLDSDYLNYWAKSRIAIVTNGVLRDTYWSGTSDNITWSLRDVRDQLNLTYLGNLGDYDKRPEWHAMYYDDADCMDLNHANSSKGNFYIRRGAERSAAKMRETIQLRIGKAQRDRDGAIREIHWLNALETEIVAGKPLSEVYL